MARALRSLGRVKEALALQYDLLTQHESAGTPDGYVAEDIAEILALLGKDDEARSFFAQPYDKLSQDPWLVENEA